MTSPRIYLSPPHMSGLEQWCAQKTCSSNWIAPLGRLLYPNFVMDWQQWANRCKIRSALEENSVR